MRIGLACGPKSLEAAVCLISLDAVEISHAISIPKGQRIHNAYMLSYVRIDEKVISVMLSSYVVVQVKG